VELHKTKKNHVGYIDPLFKNPQPIILTWLEVDFSSQSIPTLGNLEEAKIGLSLQWRLIVYQA
jgi:hypothetical protein